MNESSALQWEFIALADWDPVLGEDPHLRRYAAVRDKLHSEEWGAALDDLEALAHEGSVMSMLLIADAMRTGWLYRQDLEAAKAWYAVAAESGALRGWFGLGLTHLKSEQYDEAVRYLSMAADAGYPPALNALAGVYFRGDLGARDLARAARFWSDAVEAGHVSAKVNYNFWRARGRFGALQIVPGIANYVAARLEQDRIRSIPQEFDRL